VGDRDTLTSVAARFDTTPSELSKLNRLGSTFIYSGQQLWVPTKGEGRPGGGLAVDAPSPDPCHDHESQDDLPPEEKGNLHRFYLILLAADLLDYRRMLVKPISLSSFSTKSYACTYFYSTSSAREC